MGEGQLRRVEALPRQPRHGLLRPVHRVPQQGVADVGHVHPDLVGAAGLQAAGDVAASVVRVNHLPVGHRLPAVGGDGHPLAVGLVPSDGGGHRAPPLLEAARRYSVVQPEQGVVLELGGQGQVGPVVFRRDNQAGGVPVDAVDDAGAQRPVDAGKAVFAVI